MCRCVKIEVLSPGDEAGGDVCDSSGLNMHMNMIRCVCLCESHCPTLRPLVTDSQILDRPQCFGTDPFSSIQHHIP